MGSVHPDYRAYQVVDMQSSSREGIEVLAPGRLSDLFRSLVEFQVVWQESAGHFKFCPATSSPSLAVAGPACSLATLPAKVFSGTKVDVAQVLSEWGKAAAAISCKFCRSRYRFAKS